MRGVRHVRVASGSSGEPGGPGAARAGPSTAVLPGVGAGSGTRLGNPEPTSCCPVTPAESAGWCSLALEWYLCTRAAALCPWGGGTGAAGLGSWQTEKSLQNHGIPECQG